LFLSRANSNRSTCEPWIVRTIPETTLRADHLIGGDRIWRRSCPDRTTMRHAANPDSPQTPLGKRASMNVAIFISRGNSPQRHREHGGFFWGTRGHAPRWFGRCAALRVAIHPSSSNYHEQTPNLQTRTTAQQTFFSPADLGALCASVVKSSSSAIHRTRAAGNSMTASAFGCSKSGSF
jgi:hypothetical protein